MKRKFYFEIAYFEEFFFFVVEKIIKRMKKKKDFRNSHKIKDILKKRLYFLEISFEREMRIDRGIRAFVINHKHAYWDRSHEKKFHSKMSLCKESVVNIQILRKQFKDINNEALFVIMRKTRKNLKNLKKIKYRNLFPYPSPNT
jgi:hypothetical protein